MPVVKIVYCQKWEESERGWGIRPDGYSLHKTMKDLNKAICDHHDNFSATVPDVYSRTAGSPYPCVVDDEVYDKVQKDKSLFYNSNNYPERL